MPIYHLPKDLKKDCEAYIIYGTGEVAKQYYTAMSQIIPNERIKYFLDSQPSSKSYLDKPVIGLDELARIKDHENYCFVVASVAGCVAMVKNLKTLNVGDNQIYTPDVEDKRSFNGAPFYLDHVHKLVYYPKLESQSVLNDIIERLRWYLPAQESNQASVILSISKELRALHALDYMETISDSELGDHLQSADLVLVWDQKSLNEPLIQQLNTTVACVDPHYFSLTESDVYRRLYSYTMTSADQRHYHAISKQNYQRFAELHKDKKRSFVFGTGPSISQSFQYQYDHSLKIVCNSIVKNNKMLDHIRPDLLAFADPVFYFSHCDYSVKFREQAVRLLTTQDCYGVIPDFTLPLMLAHYPELTDKLIGMPTYGTLINFPDLDRFYVKGTSNILTSLMLPIASAFTDSVFIIGCDGRQPGETYFWKHNTTTQFDDLMQSVADAHPSYFRDRNYTDYYDDHCDQLKELIEHGELQNIKYFTLTESYIPVLSSRKWENAGT